MLHYKNQKHDQNEKNAREKRQCKDNEMENAFFNFH